ncbi:MAG TPA: 3'-5' exonuclease [Flavobacteriales bacterium]|nr:3'-5' exonuclease [Flavobacteriales bacterium]MCB0808296.1 3'-5' exonuclease [Flavobacteriales bacterium]MCB0811792.1 3'-5' exonuclease [Flavobacteriales bacterium]MCB0816775.1 3'-5' exonuclease [Flavobacteriales bacterium]MCB9181277.1 3'-5' exonuclease [Flavobacteriales bacterium]
MELKLERPLAVFDLETTGVRIGSDRIVQIGVVKLMPDGRRLPWQTLVRPGIPIPPEATAVHGISDADVADAPPLESIAGELLELLAGCDLSGFNVLRFDLPFLAEELHRVGVHWDTTRLRVVDVQRIFHKMEPRDLSAALRFYCGKEHGGAHDALADVEATADVLLAQVQRYADLPGDVDGLGEFSGDRLRAPDAAGKLQYDEQGQVCLAFGKYRGWSLEQIGRNDPGYLQWLMTKAELPGSTLSVMRNALADIEA